MGKQKAKRQETKRREKKAAKERSRATKRERARRRHSNLGGALKLAAMATLGLLAF